MIIIGGRGHRSHNEILSIQVFDTRKNNILDFPGIRMNRHCSFILDKYI